MDNAAFDAAPYSLLAFLAEAFKAKRTGTLRVQRGAYIQTAYLKEGRVAYASSNINEEKFGAVLKSMGLIGDKELNLATEKKEGRESLGKALMRLGFISNQDLYRAAVHQSQLITSHMIADGGATQFEEGRLPDNLADLKVPGDQILRELTAAISERALVLTALGGDRAMLAQSATGAPDVALQPEEKALFEKLAAPKSVSALIGPADAGFAAAKRLYFLLLCGAIESSGAGAATQETPAPALDMEATSAMQSFEIPMGGTIPPPPPPSAPPPVEDARTVRLHRDEIPPVPEPAPAPPSAKFVTSELPAPEPPPPQPATPFVAMAGIAVPSSGRRPAPANLNLDSHLGVKKASSPIARAARGQSGGGAGKKLVIILLLLLALLAGYWAFSIGPLAGKWFAALPMPEEISKLLPAAMKPGSAPASAASAANPPHSAPASAATPVSVATPVSAPVMPPPASSAAMPPVSAASVPAPPVSAASAPVKPVSAPVSASPMMAGRALLLKGDYVGAGKIFKSHLAAQSGYTIQLEVLCKPELSVPKIITALPENAPYMLVPVNFHGNPGCYRELWGLYPSAAAADSGKATIAAEVKANAGGSGHSATTAQALKENF